MSGKLDSIGILACGQVRADLVARYGEYPVMFQRLLHEVAPAVNTRAYRVYDNEYPVDPNAHDAYLISGSRFSVYDADAWICRLEDYVRTLFNARKPTVGICFGHQMMARALGGTTERATQGWGIGKHVTEVISPQSWMTPTLTHYGVFVSHQDQVTKLPPNAERIAANDHCPNSMFVVDNYFLGIQGHPEFTGDFARDLANGRAELYGPPTLARALPTYAEAVDSTSVARWIVHFLQQALLK